MNDMWMYGLLGICFCSSVLASGRSSRKKEPYKIVCYLGSWANYRRGDGKFLIEDIDTSLCTHLIYGFAKLSHDNKIAAYDTYLDLKEHWGLGAYDRFTGLKSKNPHLKTLLAVGGWNEGSSKYSRMANSASTRRTFVQSCVELLRRHRFDGLDMDWEYPATRGGKPEDKANFILLLKELKEAFEPHNLMLTAAVSAGQKTIDVAYDIPGLGRYLDLINLMAYDFHGGWDKTTGHNSPLYPRPEETGTERTLNVDYSVKYWLRKGAPSDKLVLGMPLYGRSFALRDSKHGGLNATVRGKGAAGEYTREQGFLGYHEICKMLQRDKNWRVTVDKHIQAPYIVKGSQWIGYDDVKSISSKVDYLIKMKLAGAMVWSLETDDFRGQCHGHRYPLLQAINAVLNGTSLPLPDLHMIDLDNSIFLKTISPSLPPSTTSKSPNITPSSSSTASETSSTFQLSSTTTISSGTATGSPKTVSGSSSTAIIPSSTATGSSDTATGSSSTATGSSSTGTGLRTTPNPIRTTPRLIGTTDNPKDHPFSCPHSGYFRHPTDCRYFYVCQPAPPEFELGYLVHLFECSAGTVYSQALRICAYSANVPECRDS